jgi:hypothetical protein
MTARQGIPLKPDIGTFRSEQREKGTTSITRAVIGEARSQFTNDRSPARLVRATWGTDRDALAIVTRAASSPAMTGTTGWAAELAQTRAEDMLAMLAPLSAGAKLLGMGTTLLFAGANKITFPAFNPPSASNVSFVAQGAAIPVRQLTSTAGTTSLDPRKLAVIFVLTREMLDSSNAEALVRMVVTESVSLALDAALFSSTAGDAVRPPGLLFGVSAITATAGGGSAAMQKDISALVSAVSPVAGLDIALVTDPGTATRLMMGTLRLDLPVLATNSVAAGTVIAVGLPALVSATAERPTIDATRDAEVQMDTAPVGDISTAVGPVRSIFQSDSVGLTSRTTSPGARARRRRSHTRRQLRGEHSQAVAQSQPVAGSPVRWPSAPSIRCPTAPADTR